MSDGTPGYLFSAEESDDVRVGSVPFVGRGRGEYLVAFFRGGEWVSAMTDAPQPYRHWDLAAGLTEEGTVDAAVAEGWAAVSAYGHAGALGGHYADTVHVNARGLSRRLAERVIGQLLDMGAVGFGYKVDALPSGEGDGWCFMDGTVADLLSRG